MEPQEQEHAPCTHGSLSEAPPIPRGSGGRNGAPRGCSPRRHPWGAPPPARPADAPGRTWVKVQVLLLLIITIPVRGGGPPCHKGSHWGSRVHQHTGGRELRPRGFAVISAGGWAAGPPTHATNPRTRATGAVRTTSDPARHRTQWTPIRQCSYTTMDAQTILVSLLAHWLSFVSVSVMWGPRQFFQRGPGEPQGGTYKRLHPCAGNGLPRKFEHMKKHDKRKLFSKWSQVT